MSRFDCGGHHQPQSKRIMSNRLHFLREAQREREREICQALPLGNTEGLHALEPELKKHFPLSLSFCHETCICSFSIMVRHLFLILKHSSLEFTIDLDER
jgi:hypothetical protein